MFRDGGGMAAAAVWFKDGGGSLYLRWRRQFVFKDGGGSLGFGGGSLGLEMAAAVWV